MLKQNLKSQLEMKLIYKTIITFQTSQLLQIDSDHVFKKLMNYQKTSQLYSMINSINSIQT